MTSPTNERPCYKQFIAGPISTNCYVIHDPASGKGVLVDPPEYSAVIADHIEKQRLEILWTINTHGHSDHICGNATFGYPVMIHSLDEKFLNDPALNLSPFPASPGETLKAERILYDGMRIRIGNIELEIIHTPGHTPGSVSIKCGDLVFSGDTLFFEGIGRTDHPGGDQEEIIRSIVTKLMVLDDSFRVLPGHGPETTIGHEREKNPFL
ncbi:MAG: MBL fold metallo-hydrolase [Candidatus Omnitrophota bacterium]